MDGMFDYDHDGKLSDTERMDRDYVLSGMMDHDQSDYTPRPDRTTGSENAGQTLLGVLFLMIGFSAFIYFPIFALIMIGLAIYLFLN